MSSMTRIAPCLPHTWCGHVNQGQHKQTGSNSKSAEHVRVNHVKLKGTQLLKGASSALQLLMPCLHPTALPLVQPRVGREAELCSSPAVLPGLTGLPAAAAQSGGGEAEGEPVLDGARGAQGAPQHTGERCILLCHPAVRDDLQEGCVSGREPRGESDLFCSVQSLGAMAAEWSLSGVCWSALAGCMI